MSDGVSLDVPYDAVGSLTSAARRISGEHGCTFRTDPQFLRAVAPSYAMTFIFEGVGWEAAETHFRRYVNWLNEFNASEPAEDEA